MSTSIRDQIGVAIAAPTMMAFEGEDVTYTPKNGTPVTIKAVINRQPLGTRTADGGRLVRYQFEATVQRSDVTALNPGGDTLTFKKRLQDASAVEMVIKEIIGQEAGQVRVGLS